MSAITLESLGLSKEDIAERLVESLASQLLHSQSESGDVDYSSDSDFANSAKNMVRDKVIASIEAIAMKNVLPNVAAYVESFTMQETNKWGEATKKKLTFTEYLAERAEAYMNEQVSYDGKGKGEGSYSWTGTQTRLVYLVNSHLMYAINQMVKTALEGANKALVGGIEKTVKLQLEEVSKKLAISVAVKS